MSVQLVQLSLLYSQFARTLLSAGSGGAVSSLLHQTTNRTTCVTSLLTTANTKRLLAQNRNLLSALATARGSCALCLSLAPLSERLGSLLLLTTSNVVQTQLLHSQFLGARLAARGRFAPTNAKAQTTNVSLDGLLVSTLQNARSLLKVTDLQRATSLARLGLAGLSLQTPLAQTLLATTSFLSSQHVSLATGYAHTLSQLAHLFAATSSAAG